MGLLMTSWSAVDAHIVGEVALQVGIDDQHAVAELGEDAADVEAEHRFADAALEGPEGDDLSHEEASRRFAIRCANRFAIQLMHTL